MAIRLPDSEYYLAHPALDEFILKQNNESNYLVFQHLTIGHLLPWEPFFPHFCQIEKSAQRITEPRFVQATHDLLRLCQITLKSGAGGNLPAIIDTSKHWVWMQKNVHCEASEHVILWFDEIRNSMNGYS